MASRLSRLASCRHPVCPWVRRSALPAARCMRRACVPIGHSVLVVILVLEERCEPTGGRRHVWPHLDRRSWHVAVPLCVSACMHTRTLVHVCARACTCVRVQVAYRCTVCPNFYLCAACQFLRDSELEVCSVSIARVCVRMHAWTVRACLGSMCSHSPAQRLSTKTSASGTQRRSATWPPRPTLP